MVSVNLQLPADLVSMAKLDAGNDVSAEAAKPIALELFPEDKSRSDARLNFCREADRRNMARIGL